MRRTLILFWLALLAGINLFAQTHTVTGTVTDNISGETLIGVTVAIKGTQNATTTNTNGKFSINIAGSNQATLVFSYVGYEQQVIALTNQTVVNVKLKSSSKGLEEVVVIGYGAVKKKDLTGAVTQVNMGDLEKAPVVSFEDAIGGRVAGV